MAYGVKYQLYCYGKDGITSRAVIYEDGYVGAEIDRDIAENPFTLRRDRNGAICGTSFEFIIREVVDFEFLAFYTENYKKYKVELYRPTDTLIWSGYLNTTQYETEYIPSPNNILFSATDGLGLLKNFDFYLTGFKSELEIIDYCLSPIGLGLDYSLAINIHETNHDTDRSPLAQTYMKCEAFADMTRYAVLESIVSRYDATITQYNNRWHIVSYKDRQADRLIYGSDLVYDTTESAPTANDLGGFSSDSGDVYPVDRLMLSLEAGGKKLPIKCDYGLKDSALGNFDFSDFTQTMTNLSGTFRDWENEANGGTLYLFKKTANDAPYCLIGGYGSDTAQCIYQSIEIVRNAGQIFRLRVEFAPFGWFWSTSIIGTLTQDIRFMVHLTDGSSNYYLTPTGWTTTPTEILVEDVVTSVSLYAPVWQTVEILATAAPISGTLTVYCYKAIRSTLPAQHYFYGIGINRVIVNFDMDDEYQWPAEFDDTAVFGQTTNMAALEEMEFKALDSPDFDNAELMYENVTYLGDGTLTSLWKGYGSDELLFVQVFAKLVASRNRTPLQLLRGTIKGVSFDFDTVIQHAYNDDRKFFADVVSWDIRNNKFSGDFLEYLDFEIVPVIFDDLGVIVDAPDFTVVSITPDASTVIAGAVTSADVVIENEGTVAGSGVLEWRLMDSSDEEVASGFMNIPTLDPEEQTTLTIETATPIRYESGFYFSVRISETHSYTDSTTFELVYELEITSIAVSNGSEGQPIGCLIYYTNIGISAVKPFDIYLLLASDDSVVDSSLGEYMLFAHGNNSVLSSFFEYPDVAANYKIKIVLADASYCVSNLFTSREMPTLNWETPDPISYGTALSGTQLNATVLGGIPGTFAYDPAAGTVLTAGTHKLTVTFTPDDLTSYRVAELGVDLVVLGAEAIITWTPAAEINYPATLASLFTATANVAGMFTYQRLAGIDWVNVSGSTVLDPANYIIRAYFDPTDPAYEVATLQKNLKVNKGIPTLISWNFTDIIFLTEARYFMTAAFNLAGYLNFYYKSGELWIKIEMTTIMPVGEYDIKAEFIPLDTRYRQLDAFKSLNVIQNTTSAVLTITYSSTPIPSGFGGIIHIDGKVLEPISVGTDSATFTWLASNGILGWQSGEFSAYDAEDWYLGTIVLTEEHVNLLNAGTNVEISATMIQN